MQFEEFSRLTSSLKSSAKMPALFVGHGNPMNALEENKYTKGWAQAVKEIPTPQAIMVVSAHWLTTGTHVLSTAKPRTIHDFYGFPQQLFQMNYPAPGAPDFATYTKHIVQSAAIEEDHEWGLDHGTWSILVKMYPEANIPVYQLSIDMTKTPAYHYNLAQELSALRRKGVLVIGSGNIVHNLRMANFHASAPYDWAQEFDEKVKSYILKADHKPLINYQEMGQAALLSVPTNEHYLPLLYVLALQDKDEEVSFFSEGIDLGSASMRSVRIG